MLLGAGGTDLGFLSPPPLWAPRSLEMKCSSEGWESPSSRAEGEAAGLRLDILVEARVMSGFLRPENCEDPQEIRGL